MHPLHWLTLFRVVLLGVAGIPFAAPGEPLPQGTGKFEFQAGERTLEVFTYRPATARQESLLVVIHGMNRNADDYRDNAKALADQLNALVIAPRFDTNQFPSEAFQRGGVTRQGAVQPQESWTFSFIPKLVEEVRRREGREEMEYDLIGHSAGGQFLTRMAAFLPGKARHIVAGNPGSHLFPTRDFPFQYGFGGLPAELGDDEAVRRYLAAPLTFLLGDADTGNNNLDVSTTAMKQGPTRIARGRECFRLGETLAAARGWAFNWRKIEVPGVGHDSRKLFADPLVLRAFEPARNTSLVHPPSPPLLTEPRGVHFAERFDPDQLSDRLWYNADWRAEGGVLKRIQRGTDNTRIFLRDARYRDAVIHFDFCLGNAKDVRLMTGSGGGYNTVLHLRPDHFFLQTAMDRSVPYFSYRHGECAYRFEPDRWYSITLEFLGDEAIAHVDHEHIVHAKHPMIDRAREYFAIQVDEHAAEFDNVMIQTAVAGNSAANRAKVEAAAGRFPVEKPVKEQFDIRRSNAHEWAYQRDPTYRGLVLRVDELDAALKARFPDAFRTHKESQKAVLAERKRLDETDPVYKATVQATHRAERTIENWLLAKQPGLDAVRGDRRKASLEQLRIQFADTPELVALIETARQAQAKLEADYPKLFVSDEEINAAKRAAAAAVRSDFEYQRLSKERAAAHRAQEDYLLANDAELKRLAELVK